MVWVHWRNLLCSLISWQHYHDRLGQFLCHNIVVFIDRNIYFIPHTTLWNSSMWYSNSVHSSILSACLPYLVTWLQLYLVPSTSQAIDWKEGFFTPVNCLAGNIVSKVTYVYSRTLDHAIILTTGRLSAQYLGKYCICHLECSNLDRKWYVAIFKVLFNLNMFIVFGMM